MSAGLPQSEPPKAERAADAVCGACGGPGGDPRAVPDHEYACDHLATYAICGACETAFQVPMPRVEDLAAFYPERYHSMLDGGWLLRARHRMRARRLGGLLPPGDGAVLDYGCGNGSFLRRAAPLLPDVELFGFEYADRRETETHEEGRVTIVRGQVDDLLEVLPSCRVLIMNHVIEHLPDPGGVLEALRPKLLPGAVFDGQTPNAASLEHRVFGRLWSGYHAPRHTVVFSRRGLRTLLERAGFGDIEIRGAPNPAGWAVSLASLPHGADSPGLVVREGLGWVVWVALGTALLPLDFVSRSPGMIDFMARWPD